MDTAQFPSSICDEEVISKILNGQPELFEVLIRRTNPLLYKIGLSYGFSHHDTEDLMQDTFVAAYENLDKFQHRSSFKTWVFTIMVNLCYRRSHTLSFRKEMPLGEELDNKNSSSDYSNQVGNGHEATVRNELKHVIENALQSIPLPYRMVFSLRELVGINTADTAETMGISESNVKVRLNRAKHMLRKKIGERYSLEDIFDFHLVYCNKVTASVMDRLKGIAITP